MAASPSVQHTDSRHEQGNRRVVQHGRASTTSSIAQAVVMKHDELFFLCQPNGDVPMDQAHGLGLYYHDCRYLNGYELRLAGIPADRLSSDASGGFWCTFELTNPDLKSAGAPLVEKEQVGIKWDRTLDDKACALHDSIALTNFGVEPVEVPVTIALRSSFDSLFEVRGAEPARRGSLRQPEWSGGSLRFRYDGADAVQRRLDVAFDPVPHHVDGGKASFAVSIEPQHTVTIAVSLRIQESKPGVRAESASHRDVSATRREAEQSRDDFMSAATRVHSSNGALDRVIDQSLQDLHLLRTRLHGDWYFAAGVPWYVTLFGRDSIITAIEALAFMPERAADTARLLATYQGTRHDDWRDEAPGKIMHELRVGEMAHLNEIPQTPYYGSIDATPLFLILMAKHASWTGRVDLFSELKPHVEAALNWIDDAMNANGYLAYATSSSKGLANQGWKDSGDSIVNADGSLAQPPIALVEVQGYVYLAKKGIATLYRRTGDSDTADRLNTEAEELRRRFERDFWIDELETYGLALQKNDRIAGVVSSNPGHALWTGIAAPDRASKTAHRLMQDDMFSGWGIRTLSAKERRYNPIGYHDGTVWPHDNAIAVAGFRRYGCVEEAMRVMGAIVDAATHFSHERLPEVFAGFSRDEFAVPVHYPVACHPQAWAAGAVPFMLESVLGLRPDAFNRRLHVSSPVLPAGVQTLSMERLRVGDATADITFVRDVHGRVTVSDVKTNGHLDVMTDETPYQGDDL